MTNYSSLTALFTGIADAIRAKTGSSEQIVADDFPTAIAAISTKTLVQTTVSMSNSATKSINGLLGKPLFFVLLAPAISQTTTSYITAAWSSSDTAMSFHYVNMATSTKWELTKDTTGAWSYSNGTLSVNSQNTYRKFVSGTYTLVYVY